MPPKLSPFPRHWLHSIEPNARWVTIKNLGFIHDIKQNASRVRSAMWKFAACACLVSEQFSDGKHPGNTLPIHWSPKRLDKTNGQSVGRTAVERELRGDTRIFSPLAVPRLCDTIGRYMYLFEGLTAVFGGRFYRFEHIVSYSSGKVIAK